MILTIYQIGPISCLRLKFRTTVLNNSSSPALMVSNSNSNPQPRGSNKRIQAATPLLKRSE
jgi:hypothetical protein